MCSRTLRENSDQSKLTKSSSRFLAAATKEAVTSIGLKVRGDKRPAQRLVSFTELWEQSHQAMNQEPRDSKIQHLRLFHAGRS